MKQINNSEEKLESVLFLPEGVGRKGEGGLCTKIFLKKKAVVQNRKIIQKNVNIYQVESMSSQEGENITFFENIPLITIVTVVFNGEGFLEKTILSMINQDFDNFEYIIIDGGSTDGTIEIIKKYQDKITLWVSEPDNGIYDAMNKGVKLATGQFVQFLNAGDIFLNSHTLYNISEYLKKDADIYLFAYLMDNKKYLSDLSFWSLLRGMPCHQAIFYKRQYLREFPFNVIYKYSSDYHNLINGIFSHSCMVFDETVVVYDTNGISSNPLVKKNIRKERLNAVFISNLPFFWKIPMLVYNVLRLIK